MAQNALDLDSNDSDPIVFVSELIAAYNTQNPDRGALDQPGYYVIETGEGPFATEAEALEYCPLESNT